MSPSLRLTLAALCAVSVANIYYAQPLLEAIGTDLAIPSGQLGWVVATGQIAYLIGLMTLVPLGDWMNRRLLIALHVALAAAGTLLIAVSPNTLTLLAGVAVAGLFSVVVQVIVAYTAAVSDPAERGRNIGSVTSGVVIGILLARTAAGLIADVADWRTVYLTSTVAALVLASVAVAILPRDARRTSPTTYRKSVASVFVLTATDRQFRTRATITLFVFASFGVLWSGLAFPLSEAPWHLSTTQIGLFAIAGLAGALGATRAGRWADSGRAAPATAIALASLIVSWWFIGQATTSLWLLVLGVVILDCAVQVAHVTSQSLIVAGDPKLGRTDRRLVHGVLLARIRTGSSHDDLGVSLSRLGLDLAARCRLRLGRAHRVGSRSSHTG
ncbi:MFS transporter [Aeromicrobium sp. UC242_57]|uniref:MFS transporter n=1 Tax=Aeromicrobium sp. UC242_57 TaxID=3374624 RepID=UPI0037A6CA3B